ncbi:MAG: hypothetical protein NVS9B15_21350 [Acidobacteriaceae bacterium]
MQFRLMGHYQSRCCKVRRVDVALELVRVRMRRLDNPGGLWWSGVLEMGSNDDV